MKPPGTVLVVGAGGIGHPCIAGLIAFVPRLRVADDDRVERSNLHRLPWARATSVGQPKLALVQELWSSAGRAREDLELHALRFVPETADALLENVVLAIEGADNYPTKFLVADHCRDRGIPVVHGAAVGWRGTVLGVRYGKTPCYRCIYEAPPDGETLDCASAGVYGPVTSVIGALMAAEAHRLLRTPSEGGQCWAYDALGARLRRHGFHSRQDCPLCGSSRLSLAELLAGYTGASGICGPAAGEA